MAISPDLSELVTTALRYRSPIVADNISKMNGLLTQLRKKGNIKPISGGRTIVQPVMYQENSTFKRYSGYDLLNIQPSDVITAAEFDWKQAAVAVSMSGLERHQNNGAAEVLDLLEERIINAERTMLNNIALDCYSDGTADGGRQIGGLQLLVANTPTSGTVGGINRATWPFWRNQSFSSVTNGGGAATSANIQSYMNTLYLKLVRGADRVDLIVADNAYYQLYLQSLQAIQRITSDKEAQAGFESLKYMGAMVIYDGGFGGGAPLNQMYFLNTDFIMLRPHRDQNFSPLGGERENPQQDAFVRLMGFMGNMTTNFPGLQGVLTA